MEERKFLNEAVSSVLHHLRQLESDESIVTAVPVEEHVRFVIHKVLSKMYSTNVDLYIACGILEKVKQDLLNKIGE